MNAKLSTRAMIVVAGAVATALLAVPATAQATPQDYFNALDANGVVVWDYPMMLSQGYTVCNLLRQDINPYAALVYTIGYDSRTASSIITSARYGLCPNNAVTN